MKRQRTESGFSTGKQDQIKAYWASRKFSNLYPWSTHGAQRVQRGSDYSLSNFGKSWDEANEVQRANRMFTGYSGKGSYGRAAYVGSGKYRLDRVGKHIKSGLKKAKLGQKAIKFAKRNKLGQKAADAALMAAYSGMGAYKGRGTYTGNVLMSGGRPGLTSRSGALDNQEIVITHKEYLQDVFGPSDSSFTNQLIPINPGLTESFPFLSQIAANYEEYELEQLVFEFHSTVDAGNATNGATGTIIMATNYNPDQSGFVSKEAMMQYHGGVSGRITEDVIHGVECDPKKNAGSHQKFVRTNGLSNQQLKDFDVGNFQFGIVNIPQGFRDSQIGELWVHYKIRLSKPRLFSALGKSLVLDRFSCAPSLALTTETGAARHVTTVKNFFKQITEPVAFKSNVLGLKIENVRVGTGNLGDVKITFPNYMTGYFQVLIITQSSSVVACSANLSIPPNYDEAASSDALSTSTSAPKNPRGGVTLADVLLPARNPESTGPTDTISGFGSVQGAGAESPDYGCSVTMQRIALSVVPALNGEENSIVLRFSITTGSTVDYIDQVVLECQMMNHFLPTTVNKMVGGIATNQTGELKRGIIIEEEIIVSPPTPPPVSLNNNFEMEAEYLQVLQSNIQNADGSWPSANLITQNQIMAQTAGSFVTMNNVNNKLGYQIYHSLISGGGSLVEIDFPEYIGDANWDNRYIVTVQVTKEDNENSKLAIRCVQSDQVNVDVLEDHLLTYATSSANQLNSFSGPIYRERNYDCQEGYKVFARFIIKTDVLAFTKVWTNKIRFYDYGDVPCKILAVGIYIQRYSDIGYTFGDRYFNVTGSRTYNALSAQVW